MEISPNHTIEFQNGFINLGDRYLYLKIVFLRENSRFFKYKKNLTLLHILYQKIFSVDETLEIFPKYWRIIKILKGCRLKMQ